MTKIQNVDLEQNNSHFCVTASSLKEEISEIHIIAVSGEDQSLEVKVIYKIEGILTDVKIFKLNNKFYLFGVGYSSQNKIGQESIYFFNQLKPESFLGETLSLELAHKIKKVNFIGLDVMEENVYLVSDFSIYRYNMNDLRLELFYELYDKSTQNSFSFIKCDLKTKKIYLGQSSNVLVLDEDLSNNTTIERVHDMSVSQIDVNPNKTHQILTVADDNFLKFWDVRNPKMPNYFI